MRAQPLAIIIAIAAIAVTALAARAQSIWAVAVHDFNFGVTDPEYAVGAPDGLYAFIPYGEALIVHWGDGAPAIGGTYTGTVTGSAWQICQWALGWYTDCDSPPVAQNGNGITTSVMLVNGDDLYVDAIALEMSAGTPTATATVTATATATETPTATATATETPAGTPEPTGTATATATPTLTPTPTITATGTLTPTAYLPFVTVMTVTLSSGNVAALEYSATAGDLMVSTTLLFAVLVYAIGKATELTRWK